MAQLTRPVDRSPKAVFTPQKLARAAAGKPAPEKPAPVRAEVRVELADIAHTCWQAFRYLDDKRRSARLNRERELDRKVLNLAGILKGIMGPPDLLARDWCDREAAEASFERLQAEGHCLYLTTYCEEKVYVFPAYLSRVWQCGYCDSQFEYEKEHRGMERCLCGHCGAPLELVIG